MAAPETLKSTSSANGSQPDLISDGDLFVDLSSPALLPPSIPFTNILIDIAPRDVNSVGISSSPEEVAHSISLPYPQSLEDAELARSVNSEINERNRPKTSTSEILRNTIHVIDDEMQRIALPWFMRMRQVGSAETAIVAEIAQRASDVGAQAVDLAFDTLSTAEGREAALRNATIAGEVLLIAGGGAACALASPSNLPSSVQTSAASGEKAAQTTVAVVYNRAVGDPKKTIEAASGILFGAQKTPAASGTGPEPKPIGPQAKSTLKAPTSNSAQQIPTPGSVEPTPIGQVVIQVKPSHWPDVAKAIQNDENWSGFEGVAQVLGPDLIVIAPKRPEIYGTTILLVRGDDGKVRDARDILNFASSTPTNYLVTYTFMSDLGKNGSHLENPIPITVTRYFPDARSQKLAEQIIYGQVADNSLRLSGPDGKPFIIYVDHTGKIIAAWDIRNSKMQFPGDKDFQLADRLPVKIASIDPRGLGDLQESDSVITQVRNGSGEVEYYLGPPPAPVEPPGARITVVDPIGSPVFSGTDGTKVTGYISKDSVVEVRPGIKAIKDASGGAIWLPVTIDGVSGWVRQTKDASGVANFNLSPDAQQLVKDAAEAPAPATPAELPPSLENAYKIVISPSWGSYNAGSRWEGANRDEINDPILGPLLQMQASGDNFEVKRGYPGANVGIAGAHTLIMRNFKVTNLNPLPRSDSARRASFSPLSVFNEASSANYGLLYFLNIESVINNEISYTAGNGQDYRFVLQVYDWNKPNNSVMTWIRSAPTAPNYKMGEFVDIRVDLDTDGTIRLWQNQNKSNEQWQLISKGIIPYEEARKHIVIKNIHAGLYGTFVNATCYNGKIEIYQR